MAPSFMSANFVVASAKIDTFFYSANFFREKFILFLSPYGYHLINILSISVLCNIVFYKFFVAVPKYSCMILSIL